MVPTYVMPLTREEVESLLLETMTEIDAYLGFGWTPLVDEQEFIFPRDLDKDDDGIVVIPRPVSLATRHVADAILTLRKRGVLPHQVAAESKLGHSVTKHDRRAEPEAGFEHWPPVVFGLLQKLRQLPSEWAVSDPLYL